MGPDRDFSLQGASSYEENIQQASELPCSMETGYHILPEDLQDAISFVTRRGGSGIRGFWLRQLSRIQERAQELMPVLHQLRAPVEPSEEPSRARLHVPLLEELLEENGMGGSEWRDEFVTGFPTLGELGEPGVYPPSTHPPSYISREELPKKAKGLFCRAIGLQAPLRVIFGLKPWIKLRNTGSTDLASSMNRASSWLRASQC